MRVLEKAFCSEKDITRWPMVSTEAREVIPFADKIARTLDWRHCCNGGGRGDSTRPALVALLLLAPERCQQARREGPMKIVDLPPAYRGLGDSRSLTVEE